MPAQEEKKLAKQQLAYAEPADELRELFIKAEAEEAGKIVEAKDEPAESPSPAEPAAAINEYIENGSSSNSSKNTQTLADFLQKADGPIEREKAINLVMQACDLYQLSALNGGLNPGVISIQKDEKNQYILSLESNFTKKSNVYTAPEIRQGREASLYSDVYSLGVLLYELLSNKDHSAAQNEKFENDISKWLAHSPTWGTLPTNLKQIIRSCLHDDPVLRYSSPAQLKDQLQNFLRPHANVPPPITTGGGSTSRSKNLQRFMAVAVTCIALLVGNQMWNANKDLSNPPRPPRMEDPQPSDSPPPPRFEGIVTPGTYESMVDYSGFRKPDNAETILRRAADGTLEGDYTVYEPEGSFTGTMHQISDENGVITFQWFDKYGTGTFVMQSADGKSFAGYWTHSNSSGIQGGWSGTLK